VNFLFILNFPIILVFFHDFVNIKAVNTYGLDKIIYFL